MLINSTTTLLTLQRVQQQHAPVDLLLHVGLGGDPAQVLLKQGDEQDGPLGRAPEDGRPACGVVVQNIGGVGNIENCVRQ